MPSQDRAPRPPTASPVRLGGKAGGVGGGSGGSTTARLNPLSALGETEARRGGENHGPPPAGKGKGEDGASRKRPSWARKASALARSPPPSLPRASAAPPANGKAAARPELDSFLTFTEGHLLAEASQEALGLMGSSCGRVPATGRGPAGAEGALALPHLRPWGVSSPAPAEAQRGRGEGAGGRGRGRGGAAGVGARVGAPSRAGRACANLQTCKLGARTPPRAASPRPAGIRLVGGLTVPTRRVASSTGGGGALGPGLGGARPL